MDLQELTDLYVQASFKADGYATGAHAGVAAVLDALCDMAQRRAAADTQRYDHRSLYEFAAELRYAARG